MDNPHDFTLRDGDQIRLWYGIAVPQLLRMQTLDTTGALTVSRWRPDEARRLAAAILVWADGVSPQGEAQP
jgi:hypothetical protein